MRRLLLLAVLVLPAACAPQGPPAGFGGQLPPASGTPRTRVALLLPMSGANTDLGAALSNAAQLALFEHGGPGIEFTTHDTGGTAAGAGQAARRALAEGARVIVGPLTAAETAAASGPARAAGVPMLAITNDAGQATAGVWPLGVTPAQQVRRVVTTAAQGGARRFALAGQQGPFSQQLSLALRAITVQAGLPAPVVLMYPPGTNPALVARDLAAQAGQDVPQALLLAESGDRATAVAAALAEAGLPAPPLRLMGTAGWGQDATISGDPNLVGAIFPGPDTGARITFESRYRAAFGAAPPRVAAIAYDAAALGAVAVRGGAAAQVPVGQVFQGADGALRLMPDGTVLRALAVYAVSPGGSPRVVEAATLPGQAGF
ncbi:penicillin-binding protein activator [Humitalea sp. 24SJ18S-53]|uniref:penicillin-binding protein activator n=1 Tax=Humitalea sp. 24SJ18S-53 TaxID=3422307 RepID=UPI003D67F994